MVHIPRWQLVLVLIVCVLSVSFATPNLASRETAESLPAWLPHKQLNLGLDLQGGAHLLMELDRAKLVQDHLEGVADDLRSRFRENRIRVGAIDTRDERLSFKLGDPAQVDAARQVIREINTSQVDPSGVLGAGAIFDVQARPNGGFTMVPTEESVREWVGNAIEQSLEVIRKRLDETGTREPTIQRQGEDRILVQVPGVDDPERIKALLGTTAKMTFHMVNVSANARQGERAPPGSMWLPMRENPEEQILVERRTRLSGENLVDANQTFDRGIPVVAFRFDSAGARIFGELTSQNVGRPFAIVLDDEVISAPVIRDAILGGSGIITGGFTIVEAQDLALLLRAGALPADLRFVEERSVGPGLGHDSIEAGKVASILGLVLVIVFMVVTYGRFGAMADVALLINLVMIAGALSLLQATLTLPGIAGIVLTIGIAVDANVLIFERIREEVHAGRTPISAVDAGYRRALTTIVDSNLTTFIAAILLFIFGTGPVKGFAVTLSIGLATSMFTAVMVTRLMVVTWLRRRRPAVLEV